MSTPPPSAFSRSARFAVCFTFAACSVYPSRTPLGGTYDAPPVAETADRRAPKQALPNASANASASATEPEPPPNKPVVAVAKVVADAASAVKPGDTLLYQPLKAGDRIKADVTLTFKAELRGGPPGLPASGSLGMDSKLRVELKVNRVSALALEELELTVTTLSMHTEFAGQGSDAKAEPPDVYDVTLGQSPSIRAHDGSKPDAEDRAVLLVLVAPIADFHARWAASPTLDLEPGWSSKVPVTLPKFADAHTETVQVGPLAVRYSGRGARDVASDNVPFDVTLPLQYGADMGKLDFELTGKATLSATTGRPTSIDLSGPFSAQSGGRDAGPMSFSGSTKFTAQLSYQ
ncbi:MAG: hypothetical protein ABUL62_16635 [Myxococcales bacterium]